MPLPSLGHFCHGKADLLGSLHSTDNTNSSIHSCSHAHFDRDKHCRIGEACNPGPQYTEHIHRLKDTVLITQSNAGSLRARADLVASLGTGVHCFAETHLTKHNHSSFHKQLQRFAQNQHRKVRTLTGCPVPNRSPHSEAGLWSGVLQATDFAAQQIRIPWPVDHWETSRVLLTQHAGPIPLQIATVYGYAVGPTWPQAAHLTNQLLTSITTNLVLGSSGPRLITGDFNQSKHLEQQTIWAMHGWVDAQSFAQQHLGIEPTPTNGDNSFVDQIWLSPEAALLLRDISVIPVFKGHSTIAIQLHCGQSICTYDCWPRPAQLPWDKLQQPYQPTDSVLPTPTGDGTKAYGLWAKRIEQSFAQAAQAESLELPPHYQGRGARTAPLKRTVHKPYCRSPREGELALKYDLIGVGVRHWYIQARRFQSLLHSIRSTRQSDHKLVYQIEVWSAIIQAKGFDPNFRQWWNQRTPIIEESNFELSLGVPSQDDLETINEEFIKHFRRFESWHSRQRTERYDALLQDSMQQLFKELKKPKPNTIDLLYKDRDFEVLASEQLQVHLDEQPQMAAHQHWFHEDGLIAVQQIHNDLCQTSRPLDAGAVLSQRIYEPTVEGICDSLVQHWTSKWTALNDLSEERMSNVMNFANAFLPRLSFDLAPLTTQHWIKALRRMKAKAATGADGFSRQDMLALHTDHLQWLVNLFNKLEEQQTSWPMQLLTGLVFGVAKNDQPHLPEHFRPIHLFTIAHRVWGSIRARQILRLVAPHVPADLHGYLPGHEPATLWFTLQGWIETGLRLGQHRHGASADLMKCFNCIERPQYFALSEHLGTPLRIRAPWQAFLSGCTRRFQVHHAVSQPISSTRGFPEGCPLSVLTMVHIGWAFHVWLQNFHPKVGCSTFVDNLDYHTNHEAELHAALDQSQLWFSNWGLSFDSGKTLSPKKFNTLHRRVLGMEYFPMRFKISIRDLKCKKMQKNVLNEKNDKK